MDKLDNLNHVEVGIKSGGVVIVLDKGEVINSEAEAMLQALHSRSTGGLTSHLEVLKEKGSDKFMSSFYVGYGHKSIGDCGSATLFIEGVSMLVAKAIQDSSLYSGQEASTRYIDFSQQEFINILGTDEGNEILESQREFYLSLQDPIQAHLKNLFPIKDGEKELIYNKAIAAKAFDISRGFLPAGASTNLAWHSNLRQIADRLLFLRHHPLEEVRDTANAIEKAVLIHFPNSFTTERFEATEQYQKLISKNYYYHNPNQKDLELAMDSIDRNELNKFKELIEARPNNKTEFPKYMSSIGELKFNFNLDYGSFRDLQRHRAINQRMPLLTTEIGFHPWYIESLPEEMQEKAKEFLQNLQTKLNNLNITKEELQYYIPMGYMISNSFVGDLPAIIYMCELRATRFVHPTLRNVARDIGEMIQKKFNIKLHFDEQPDRFDIKRGEHDIVMK